jgi:predicted kinase
MSKKLILTMGLPRSGKSTWAKQQSVPIVSPDAIRLAMTGQRWVGELEDMVWVVAKYMVRSLFLAGMML